MAYIRFASFGAILVCLACESDTFRLELPEQVAAASEGGPSEEGPSGEEVAEPKEAGEPEPETGPTPVEVVSDAGFPGDAAVDAGGVADADEAPLGDGDGDGDAGPPLGDGGDVDAVGLVVAVVAVGGGNTCVLRDGQTQCWGDNAFGQSTPLDVEFLSIGLGNTHGCGLRPDGTAECWGNNEDGRATAPTGVRFSSLAVGSAHSCGLGTNGRAVCWGRSTFGRAAPPDRAFDSIAVGGAFGCGLAAGDITCWGELPAPPKGSFAAITAGDGHACALDAAGRATCWGSDAFGQSAPPALAFSALSAGNGHTCGLADGQVTCWGAIEAPPEGTSGDLAEGPGAGHACAAAGGQVTCWGESRDGQTGVPASLKGL